MSTYATKVRVGDRREWTWNIQEDGINRDLSAATSVKIYLTASNGVVTTYTAGTDAEFALTTAASGLVTLSPSAATFGSNISWWDVTFGFVLGGKTYLVSSGAAVGRIVAYTGP